MTRIVALVAVCLWVLIGSAHAVELTVSGYLDDSTNPALVGSDGYMDLHAPRFGNDDEIARNVALYELTVSAGATVFFDSFGYAAFGAEPYFSLFDGSGTAATFVDSNFNCDFFNIDFSCSLLLTAGTYMVALGVWENMSFAENNPDADPALGDGFTALGDPNRLGSYYYELRISSDEETAFEATPAGDLRSTPPTIPAPSTLLLVGCGLVGLARTTRARMRERAPRPVARHVPR